MRRRMVSDTGLWINSKWFKTPGNHITHENVKVNIMKVLILEFIINLRNVNAKFKAGVAYEK